MTEPPMIRVRWTDAQGDAHGWTPIAELDDEPCIVTTVGHLVPGRTGHVTVALSWHPDEADQIVVDSVVHIPEGMVVSLENLVSRPA